MLSKQKANTRSFDNRRSIYENHLPKKLYQELSKRKWLDRKTHKCLLKDVPSNKAKAKVTIKSSPADYHCAGDNPQKKAVLIQIDIFEEVSPELTALLKETIHKDARARQHTVIRFEFCEGKTTNKKVDTNTQVNKVLAQLEKLVGYTTYYINFSSFFEPSANNTNSNESKESVKNTMSNKPYLTSNSKDTTTKEKTTRRCLLM